MKKKSKEKQSEQLQMSYSTAWGQLRKNIMFRLAQNSEMNVCYRCGKEIIACEEISIDHKKDWMYKDNAKELYFDLQNIAFSHYECNTHSVRGRVARNTVSGYKGVKYYPKKAKPWCARIFTKEKVADIGTFMTAEEAAKAYDNKALELFGEDAITNELILKFAKKHNIDLNKMTSNQVKEVTLGMTLGKANYKLIKSILFYLSSKNSLDYCYRCNEKIEDIGEFSIDHKDEWLDSHSPKDLFFNLDNISFSHELCNKIHQTSVKNTGEKNISGFRGVTKRRRKWHSIIGNGNEKKYLGSYANPIEAAKRYDEEAIKLFGERAITNKKLGLL